MGSAFDHSPSITVPSSSTNNRIVTWNGSTGKNFNNTALVEIAAGVVTGITSLSVDNIQILDNAIVSTNSNGNIGLTPNGSGAVVISKLQVTSSGAQDGYVLTSTDGNGNVAWEEAGGGAISAVTNGSSDRIATFTSTTALNGEANLTFDGQNLYLINSTTDSSSNLMVNSSATSGTTHARLILRVGSGNAGDAFISFHNQAGAGTEWQLGMDSSDADAGGAKKFKLGYGSGLDSSRTSMIVTNAPGSGSGASACSQLPQINFPTRSCGTVRVSSDINNQTGDGNQYQVQFGTVVYDQNNDWSNAATGGNGNTFYAPVSGLYLFIVQISFKDNLSADSNEILVYLNTNYPSGGGTNYNLFNQPGRPDGIGTGNPYSTGGSVIAYLEAGDYANVKVRVSGDGSNNVQIEGGGGFASFFSWALLA